MARDPDSYKPANLWLGALWFLFSKQRFLEMASEHVAWVNLKAPDLRAAYLNGSFDPEAADGKELERERLSGLRAQFWKSLFQLVVVGLTALCFGVFVGAVGTSLPLHRGHLLGFIGGFLAAWATLFELGGPKIPSIDGETLCELIHPKIFQIVFLPGALLSLAGVLL